MSAATTASMTIHTHVASIVSKCGAFPPVHRCSSTRSAQSSEERPMNRETAERLARDIAAHRELGRRAMLSSDPLGRWLLKRDRPDLYIEELAGAPITAEPERTSAERMQELREADVAQVLAMVREANEDFERAGGTG
jgi:hypothetical protein